METNLLKVLASLCVLGTSSLALAEGQALFPYEDTSAPALAPFAHSVEGLATTPATANAESSNAVILEPSLFGENRAPPLPLEFGLFYGRMKDDLGTHGQFFQLRRSGGFPPDGVGFYVRKRFR